MPNFFLSLRAKYLQYKYEKLKKKNCIPLAHSNYFHDFIEKANNDHEEYKRHLRTKIGFFKSIIPNTKENEVRNKFAKSLENANKAFNSITNSK